MTPREPYSESVLTRDGVKVIVQEYDQSIILPRQMEQHKENLRVQKEHTEILNQWQGALRVCAWLLTAVLGIMTVVIGVLMYEHETHRSFLQSWDAPNYTASQSATR